jgi:hypothetical protein
MSRSFFPLIALFAAFMVGSLFQSPSASSGELHRGAEAVLMCNDVDGTEYEAVTMECLDSDTFSSCTDRLAQDLREDGYDYPSSYCDVKKTNPGWFESDTITLHGHITIK